jgi:hypothetical protein
MTLTAYHGPTPHSACPDDARPLVVPTPAALSPVTCHRPNAPDEAALSRAMLPWRLSRGTYPVTCHLSPVTFPLLSPRLIETRRKQNSSQPLENYRKSAILIATKCEFLKKRRKLFLTFSRALLLPANSPRLARGLSRPQQIEARRRPCMSSVRRAVVDETSQEGSRSAETNRDRLG